MALAESGEGALGCHEQFDIVFQLIMFFETLVQAAQISYMYTVSTFE